MAVYDTPTLVVIVVVVVVVDTVTAADPAENGHKGQPEPCRGGAAGVAAIGARLNTEAARRVILY
uniref:Secreted protein n=1 Tax=Oryza sativa subsp. japonica TaxID=39947 RepID=Q6K7X4_ORYSJ|nr:hypothetical protein [Oryza sativa Japonica Group]